MRLLGIFLVGGKTGAASAIGLAGVTAEAELQYWRIKFVVTFPSRFVDSRIGSSNFRYSLSCGPGSQDSKLVLNFSVVLFLLILWPF